MLRAEVFRAIAIFRQWLRCNEREHQRLQGRLAPVPSLMFARALQIFAALLLDEFILRRNIKIPNASRTHMHVPTFSPRWIFLTCNTTRTRAPPTRQALCATFAPTINAHLAYVNPPGAIFCSTRLPSLVARVARFVAILARVLFSKTLHAKTAAECQLVATRLTPCCRLLVTS